MGAPAQRPSELIQGINVTPLVDVVLVLLVVLMVSASYTVSKALPVELPTAQTGESKTSPLAISIDKEGTLFVDGVAQSHPQLRQRVRSRKEAKADVSALIAADGSVQHRAVIKVVDLLRSEGVTKFAINVAPEDI
jgi:biopolymer transport protein ExbD